MIPRQMKRAAVVVEARARAFVLRRAFLRARAALIRIQVGCVTASSTNLIQR